MAKAKAKAKAKKTASNEACLSKEVLLREARRLAAVLRALRKTRLDITSDMLWESILQRWSEKDLERALREFEESAALTLFEELLQPLPQASEEGFFEDRGEEWGLEKALVRRLQIGEISLSQNLGSCRSRGGKDARGFFRTFYALKDVKKACADLLKDVPRANKEGFFKADGEEWGMVEGIYRLLNKRITPRTIRLRACKHSCRSRDGKTCQNKPETFYALKDVKKACADLLKDVPRANKEGFFKADGEEWGIKRGLQQRLGIGDIKRVRLKSCRSRKRKNYLNRPETFYALKDVKKACADLLKDVPRANKEGFFKADGEEWGMVRPLHKRLGPSERTLVSRLSSCRFREGKEARGHIKTFYALKDVKKACADLLRKKCLKKNAVTATILAEYAAVMAKVLKTLRQQHRGLRSDDLWRAITTRWTERQFQKAIAAFTEDSDVSAFNKLLR